MFEYRRIELDAVDLHVADSAGREPTLILLHGVTRRWQSFLPILPWLQLRYRLVLVDLRGHGQSGAAASEYFVSSYVADVCELIRNHLQGPVHLYGHSLGAMTAAAVAAALPDRVVSAVLEDPPLHTMGTRIHETSLHSYFSCLSKFAGHDQSVTEVAAALADAVFVDPQTDASYRIGDSRNNAQLLFAARSLQQLDPRVFEPILQGTWLQGFDVATVFTALQCPVLLLQADYAAGGMLTEDDAEEVTSLNSNIAPVYFPETGHGIHWTATEQLVNVVLPFLESVHVAAPSAKTR